MYIYIPLMLLLSSGSHFLTSSSSFPASFFLVFVLLSFSLYLEYQGYQSVGDEIIVSDMHTRKKMMFDRVRTDTTFLSYTFVLVPSSYSCILFLHSLMHS